ncbi:hypothetical protein M440DRAFT_1472329 [Trichoderma longibrachiatum ATCC 18648]|uniref:EamA domain-containing protein n=1 Tax=Trichoderma longibrachiatum ATCC 18648 TaxID=983965 RepID=A0A2T4BUN9_TRILO|nr:hypothetical protein M440DRAFT_1472329 [Trichoderma longibrachiatum ATCC 18648]
MDARKRRATTKPTSPDSQPHQRSSSSSTTTTTIPSSAPKSSKAEMEALNLSSSRASWRQHWMFFAVASGACAAFNGVFAKLTTTELTSNLSTAIAKSLSLQSHSSIIFFILNLTFNGIMWSLFTTALAKGKSATQVSIMNTSTNFLVTAFTGLVIFSEALPPMWWAGASLLVAGSVIAGRKDEGEGDAGDGAEGDGAVPVPVPLGSGGVLELDEDLVAGERYRDEDVPDLGELRS